MTEPKKANRFSGFGTSENEQDRHATVDAGREVSANPPVQAAPAPDQVDGAPRKNHFGNFDFADQEDPRDASIRQAMEIGAVVGGYKGAKSGLNERLNTPVGDRGSQAYLNGMLPPDVKLTVKNLQFLTGMPARTQAEIQAALAQLQAAAVSREPRLKTTPSGQTIRSGFTTTPSRPTVDLTSFEVPSAAKAGATGAVRGALAGVTAGPALYQAATQDQPIDWTQWSSIAGALPTIAPKIASKIPGLNAIAPYLGIPYAIKHKEELARAMTMHDVNPTAFPLGSPGADEPFVPRP